MKAMVLRALACMVAAIGLGANVGFASPIPVNISYNFTSGSLPAGNVYSNGVVSPNPYGVTAPTLSVSASAVPSIPLQSFTPSVTASTNGLGVSYTGTTFPVTIPNPAYPFIGPPTIVIAPSTNISDSDPGNVDNFFASETLSFTLGPASPQLSDFKLASITLGNIANGLFIDDDVVITVNGVDYPIDPDTAPWFIFDFGDAILSLADLDIVVNPGDTISIWAPGINDDFTVAGISFSALSTPEPGSLAVWSMLAVGGLLYRRRRLAARA